uniref:CUB and zona pellucida-like domains 1, tandem duplicate 2 n=1 Tax=Tetraodon nigroviridis TaxID=99883 RepID=H3D752_TETNG
SCYWYIRPGRGIIELDFSYVNIEYHSSCIYDAVYVYDGSSSSSRLLGRLCGSQRATFYSTGAYLTVYFKSDNSVTYQGFRANYQVTVFIFYFFKCSCLSINSGAPCGGYLYGSNDTFYSPNYPNSYPNYASCYWYIRPGRGIIELDFSYVNIEYHSSCGYDAVYVYDGYSSSSRLLGRLCGSQRATFYSTGAYLTVYFSSNYIGTYQGFRANYQVVSIKSSNINNSHCNSANMTIVISTFYLNSLGYDGSNVYLDDPLCRPQFSKYNVTFSFPIDSCGNVKTFEDGRTVYTNSLRAYPTTYGEITRQDHLKLLVGCRMEQDSVSQIMYRVEHRDNSSITGSGRYATLMHFYTSSSFSYKVTQVPYEVLLNQELFVQVEMENKDRSLVVFIDTCLASPSPHDFQTRAYYLVRNGCGADSTYKAYASGFNNYARFSFKAFQFLRATESVYLQCKVLICQASDANSRCRRGCSRRKTRDLQAQHDSQTLVTGPIQLKGFKKKDKE